MDNEELVSRLARLEERMNAMTTAIEGVNEGVAALRRVIAGNGTRGLTHNVTLLEERVRSIGESVGSMRGDLANVETGLSQTLQAMQRQMASVVDDVAQHERAIEAVRTDVAKNKLSLNSLQERVKSNVWLTRSLAMLNLAQAIAIIWYVLRGGMFQ